MNLVEKLKLVWHSARAEILNGNESHITTIKHDIYDYYNLELEENEFSPICPLCTIAETIAASKDEDRICFRCPMYGKWPDINEQEYKKEVCTNMYSAYAELVDRELDQEQRLKYVDMLIDAFDEELKDEDYESFQDR